MADRRKGSYSWKSPWAFNSLYAMRRSLTERFVYKKLGLLERHSSFKKPYLQRSSHKIGELMYSPRGWGIPPWGSPPGGGGGGGGGGPAPYDIPDEDADQWECESCKIVGSGEARCGESWQGQIIPSECAGFNVFAMGLEENADFDTAADSAGRIIVVIPENSNESEMIVCNSGGIHGATCCTTIKIVCDCCETFTVTADQSTVNPGGTATFTISPPCPGATATATSNSGCTLSASVNPSGSSASVTVGASDCGSFYVTVSKAANENCDAVSADSGSVRINNTGQGGSWTDEGLCENHAEFTTGLPGNAEDCIGIGGSTVDAEYTGQYKLMTPGFPIGCGSPDANNGPG